MKRTALIVIDIQNDYFKGGNMPLHEPEAAANQAAKLLTTFRQSHLPIVHIQHEAAKPDMSFMQPNTLGQAIHHSVKPLEHETVILKHFPNAFWQTELEEVLKAQHIDSLILCGMMTHMCISATARAGMERGYNILIAQDACATTALSLGDKLIDAETVPRNSTSGSRVL